MKGPVWGFGHFLGVTFVDNARLPARLQETLNESRGLGMNIDDYQDESRKTAIYPKVTLVLDYADGTQSTAEAPWLYPILGLLGEAGELADKLKKVIRDKNGLVGDPSPYAKEAGDVTWYVARLADAFGVQLSDVLAGNTAKLQSRQARGQLQGSGDER